MELQKQQAYIRLKKELDECRALGTNLLIVTLPGTGMGRMVKEYVEGARNKEVLLITSDDQDLGTYNLVNTDWADQGVLEKVEKIFKKARTDQKIAITINYPTLLNDEKILKSFFINHTYRKYYFGFRDESDSKQMCREINQNLSTEDQKKIFKLSGGLAQLVKYLAVNGVENRDGVGIILNPVIKAVTGASEDTLSKLGVWKDGQWAGELLSDKCENSSEILIKINFDLSFEESGKQNKQKLTPLEKLILEKFLENKGRLTKEQVSDIKWGEGKYDEYSDQAINKQLRRLADKLAVYTIQTVPKVGFIIKRK